MRKLFTLFFFLYLTSFAFITNKKLKIKKDSYKINLEEEVIEYLQQYEGKDNINFEGITFTKKITEII